MTDESKANTEKWIEEKGAKYAYAYDPGGKLQRELGVGGIPHAFLLDPTGRVVWEGHPGNLTEDIISTNLKGALKEPVWNWPKEAAAVRKALTKRAFAQAVSEAEKAADKNEQVAEIKTVLQGLIAARLDAVKEARKSGDFLAASTMAQALAKEASGLPEGDEAGTIKKEIDADSDAQKVIAGQNAVKKLSAREIKKAKDAEAALKKLEKISSDLPGTAAARDADAFAAQLRAMLEKLGK